MKHMKKLSTMIGCSMLSACAMADSVCQKAAGVMICQAGEVDTISSAGVVKANGTHVKKKVTIKGQAIFNRAELNDMRVLGELCLRDSLVKGQGKIYGFLNTQGSKFQKTIEVIGDNLRADSCEFEDIIMEAYGQTAAINLGNKTVVKGNVVFKGSPGLVTLTGQSKILGKIINGKQA